MGERLPLRQDPMDPAAPALQCVGIVCGQSRGRYRRWACDSCGDSAQVLERSSFRQQQTRSFLGRRFPVFFNPLVCFQIGRRAGRLQAVNLYAVQFGTPP